MFSWGADTAAAATKAATKPWGTPSARLFGVDRRVRARNNNTNKELLMLRRAASKPVSTRRESCHQRHADNENV
jgi:hypothetical protein